MPSSVRPHSFSNAGRGVLLTTCCIILLCCGAIHAQDLSLTTATMYDENILDMYSPTSDRITEFGLEASNDWDFDQSSINLSYNGSLLFYRDFPEKSYHVHALSLNSNYRFEHETDDADDSTGETTARESGDSTGILREKAAPAQPVLSQDSTEQILYGSLNAASQFDRSENSTYDNSMVSGSIAFRQPLGEKSGARPSYTLSYHSYPNLSGITNYQNDFGLLLSENVMPGTWVGILPVFSVKTYPTQGAVRYTVATRVLIPPRGHGRGATWKDTTISGEVSFTVPSVSQFAISGFWMQKITQNLGAWFQYNFFASPSGVARVLPDVLRNGVHGQGSTVDVASQDDIVDDRFSFSAHQFQMIVNATLPLSFALTLNGMIESKSYTYPAKDLFDSTIANQRLDDRFDLAVSLARRWHITETSSLKPQVEYRYLHNHSNAPYYDFNKNLFLAEIDFNF